jgi:hypothetical protein
VVYLFRAAAGVGGDWKACSPTITGVGYFDIDRTYRLKEKKEDGLVKCYYKTRFSLKRADGPPESGHYYRCAFVM